MRNVNRCFTASKFRLNPQLALVAAGALIACDQSTSPPDSPPEHDLSSTMTGMEMPNPKDMRSPPRGAGTVARLPAARRLAPPYTPIPGSMLGTTVDVNLACDYARRGWMVDMMGNCQRTSTMNTSTEVKSIRIDPTSPGVYRITAGKMDAYAMDYMVTTSEMMPDAVYTDGADPAMTIRLTHSYELQPRTLHVETELLHDNDAPLPPTMCSLYYYERTHCTGNLTW